MTITITTYTLLQIYFAINTFFAGYYLAQEYPYANDKVRRKIILTTICSIFFAIPYIISLFIFEFFKQGLKWLNNLFLIDFWFEFYLTKKWNNVEEDHLRKININALNRLNSLEDRMFKKAVKLINKRNNYTLPDENPTPF